MLMCNASVILVRLLYLFMSREKVDTRLVKRILPDSTKGAEIFEEESYRAKCWPIVEHVLILNCCKPLVFMYYWCCDNH